MKENSTLITGINCEMSNSSFRMFFRKFKTKQMLLFKRGGGGVGIKNNVKSGHIIVIWWGIQTCMSIIDIMQPHS